MPADPTDMYAKRRTNSTMPKRTLLKRSRIGRIRECIAVER
jgi:hypothetical protein